MIFLAPEEISGVFFVNDKEIQNHEEVFIMADCIAVFCAVTSGGCGGSGSPVDTSESAFSENVNNETISEQENEEGRGGSASDSSSISVHINVDTLGLYTSMAFYARPKNGLWEQINSWENGSINQDFTISNNNGYYVEFGFEANFTIGPEWPHIPECSGLLKTPKKRDTLRTSILI